MSVWKSYFLSQLCVCNGGVCSFTFSLFTYRNFSLSSMRNSVIMPILLITIDFYFLHLVRTEIKKKKREMTYGISDTIDKRKKNNPT